ncbi:MAG: SMP-30/gluconolactonase/LRE family protein [Myxococcales bacterium]|nr:SMP-30/gluconolactonase/LRE family protein [Myxococcales bacterium]
MNKKKVIGVSVGALLLAAAGYGLFLFIVAGQLNPIAPHFAGTCTSIAGVVGSEDITIDQRTGMAFIAAIDRHKAHAGQPVKGAIWGYDLSTKGSKPVNLTADFDKPFGVHGLSLVSAGGKTSVMVVNHGAGNVFDSDGDRIENFEYTGGKLVHRVTVSDPKLRAINDILALDHIRFYATLDHGHPTGLMRKVEDYGRLKRGSVIYYDGKTVRTVAEGFRYTNGINMSADGKTVYVAATTDAQISTFDRDLKTGDLSGRRDFDFDTGVDNIERDAQGHLWIGSHPHLFDFLSFSKDPSSRSPSQVLKIDMRTGAPKTTEVYLNDGDPLSGSSVAARWRNRLLIGTVFDPTFLDCTLP